MKSKDPTPRVGRLRCECTADYGTDTVSESDHRALWFPIRDIVSGLLVDTIIRSQVGDIPGFPDTSPSL